MIRVRSRLRLRRLVSLHGFLLVLLLCLLSQVADARPPAIESINQPQLVRHAIDPDDLLRIWVVFVDQGDGLLIQLPPRFRGADGDRLEVLIDGGPYPQSRKNRHWITNFLQSLYGSTKPALEYAVLTHHDEDHVAGLTRLLLEGHVTVQHLFHNGLASYLPSRHGFRDVEGWDQAVVKRNDAKSVTSGMAFLDQGRLLDKYLINDLDRLRMGVNRREFAGVYQAFAEAVAPPHASPKVRTFSRASQGNRFIALPLSPGDPDPVPLRFQLIWPLPTLEKYGSESRMWSETINGNSVTFRLTYGDFQMLFPGDHNEKSEQALLKHLKETNRLDLLRCDVLKVPHHGSSHADPEFFRAANPALSVASMGEKGFASKAMSTNAWQHPSTAVIDWLGGPERVYHTFIHEKKFDWSKINTKQKRSAMIERTHVLIETDGEYFRLVELNIDDADVDLKRPPSVDTVQRGNGTRWIRAK